MKPQRVLVLVHKHLVPPETATVPSTREPSLNVTVPPAAAGVTAAVRVTGLPATTRPPGETASVVPVETAAPTGVSPMPTTSCAAGLAGSR